MTRLQSDFDTFFVVADKFLASHPSNVEFGSPHYTLTEGLACQNSSFYFFFTQFDKSFDMFFHSPSVVMIDSSLTLVPNDMQGRER